MPLRRAVMVRSSRSTARRFLRDSSSPSSSVTKRAPSPARIGGSPDNSSMPTRARSIWTRLRSCRWLCKPSSSTCCRTSGFRAWGGQALLAVDIRVIAATNRNLEEAMASGQFRADLYYRLNVVEIRVPPLRERREEIPGLAARFLARFNAQYGRHKELMPETLARL